MYRSSGAVEIVRFWKETPRVESGGQSMGFGWARAVEARARAWKSGSRSIVGLE